MNFVIFSTDKPGAEALRKATRPIHRDWLHGQHDRVRLLMSGATLHSDGRSMNGSMIIVSAECLEDVQVMAEEDPYRQAGLFAHWEIRPWDWTYGNPAGTPSINPI